MKTRIIRNVEDFEIEGDRGYIAECARFSPDKPIDLEDFESPTFETVHRELVKGRKFGRMTNGTVETWLIGFDRRTCESLEILPTGEFEELEKYRMEVPLWKSILQDREARIAAAKNATWWQRLKWLFTGISI